MASPEVFFCPLFLLVPQLIWISYTYYYYFLHVDETFQPYIHNHCSLSSLETLILFDLVLRHRTIPKPLSTSLRADVLGDCTWWSSFANTTLILVVCQSPLWDTCNQLYYQLMETKALGELSLKSLLWLRGKTKPHK